MNNAVFSVNQTTPHQLRNARMHEVCGPAAFGFAAAVCAEHEGDVIWIDEVHQVEQVLPAGLKQFCNPGRVVFARARSHLDVLWMAEECLRSKAVPIVLVRLSQSLNFTQGRRLQLAAETGKSLGLLLVGEGAGSNVAETRWQCTPCFDANDSTLQHWQLIKNKSGTLRNWIVNRDEQTHRIVVVSQAGERPGFARASD